jgi:hypothetical protein
LLGLIDIYKQAGYQISVNYLKSVEAIYSDVLENISSSDQVANTEEALYFLSIL